MDTGVEVPVAVGGRASRPSLPPTDDALPRRWPPPGEWGDPRRERAAAVARTAVRTFVRWAVAITAAGIGLGVGTILLARQAAVLFTAGTVGTGAERVELGPLATRSQVYAANGTLLGIFHDEEYRVPVALDRVPAHVVTAVLDAEDERFFEHGPLDIRAMARAMVSNLSEGQVSEGGSTITQQLVKTVLLTSKLDVNRKLREAALAIRLEDQMTKRQILERYLNTVYFGNSAYGIQAAAERYFRTDVDELTMGQAVLLAGLIRNPVYADPFVNPGAARERRDVIIDRMLVLRHVTATQAVELKAEALPAPPPDLPASGSDYFTEYVKQQLLDDPRLGDTYGERYRAVFKGGLAVHTTLNSQFQRIAEETVSRTLPDSGGRFTAALVSVDPANGAVRALVGGGDFERTKFNLVTDTEGRQAGSAFKVFTLVAALEQGILPTDRIFGTAPCTIPNPGGTPDPWRPGNVEGQAAGVISLVDATVQSVNCAYARLVKVVGPQKVADVATRMGIANPLSPNLAITLGSELVTPLQMATAYATLAADGERHTPYVIDRVEDSNGRVVLRNTPKGERAVSTQIARTINQTLTQVVARGTGRAAAVRGWQVAGKTGSTDENADAWFVGYTTKLATAVWMGSPSGRVSMYNVGGVPRVYGGTFPAEIWGAYTREALGGGAAVDFPPPDRSPARPPRLLLLPGERPPEEQDRERDRTDEAGGSTVSTMPPGPRFTLPDLPPLPPVTFPHVSLPPEIADLTTRPSRARTTTTVGEG